MKRRILALLLALSFVFGSVNISYANGDSTQVKVKIKLKDSEGKLFTKEQLAKAQILIKEVKDEEEEIKGIAISEDDSTPKEAYFYFRVDKNNEQKKIKLESSKYDFSKIETEVIPAGYEFTNGILMMTKNADENDIILQATEKVKKHKLTVNFDNAKDSGIKMKVDNEEVADTYKASLEEGEHKVSFDIPSNYVDVKIIPAKDPAKTNDLKPVNGIYTVDLKKDTTLNFVVENTKLKFDMDEIVDGDRIFHGNLKNKDSNATYKVYVIHTDKDGNQKQDEGTVTDSGILEVKDKGPAKLGQKLSFYVYDETNKVYSETVTVEVGYKVIPFEIQDVYENQSLIKGKITKDSFDTKANKVYFELYKVDAEGKMEEKPYTVFKTAPDNSLDNVEIFKINKDKTFELDNKVKFTKDDKFVLIAKAGTDYKSELPFEILEHGETKRVSGKDRYATALDTAKEAYEKTDNLVLAYGGVAADALAAGPLANALDAPIVLTGKDNLYTGIQNFIKTREVKNVIIVGGTGSVSNFVKNQLKDVKVNRISGKDRFETSVKVAELLVKDHGFSKEHIIVANGYIDADALAVAPLATQEKQAILLTRKDLMPEVVQDFVTEQEVVKATIAGGKGTIDDDVVVKNELTIAERISGSDRYATSLEIAKKLKDVDAAIFVNGFKSPDALTAAPLAKVKNAAILLVKDPIAKKDNDPAIKYIKEKEIKKIYLAGGTGSLEEALETYFNKYIKDLEK